MPTPWSSRSRDRVTASHASPFRGCGFFGATYLSDNPTPRPECWDRICGRLPTSAESSSISTNSKSGTVGAPLRISEEELALRFTPRLRLFAARQLNDSAGAEDVTQEVLRLVIEAIRGNRIDNQEALPGFVFQTARNVCMHWVRSRLREKTAFARYERESTEESSGSDALESLVSAERAQEVKRALGRLHPDDRQLLAMIYYDEFDTADIARRFNITPAALRVRKHRALQRLSAELELAGNESGKAGTL